MSIRFAVFLAFTQPIVDDFGFFLLPQAQRMKDGDLLGCSQAQGQFLLLLAG